MCNPVVGDIMLLLYSTLVMYTSSAPINAYGLRESRCMREVMRVRRSMYCLYLRIAMEVFIHE